MANNEHISDNNQSTDKLATSLSLEKPSTLDLSETNLDSNKEVTKVFQLLLARVIEKPKDDKANISYKSFWNKLAPTFLIKISFIGGALFFVLSLISILLNHTVVVINITLPGKVFYFIIYLCFFTLFLWSRLSWDVRQLKSPQKYLEEEFVVAMNEAGVNDWQLVEAVVKEANHQKEILKYVEKKINRKLEIQDREKSSTTVIQDCSVFSIVILILILFPQYFQNLLESRDVKLWSGILALLAAVGAGFNLIYRLIIESGLQFQIVKLKDCICLLQQAQLLIDDFKDNEIEQSKRGNKKPSLLKRLQNISIEGPEDFAANHDMYISGEKRIEPDIR